MSDEVVISSNMEEYLETLYSLTLNGQTASTTEVSERLKIAPASVTEMLKKLDDNGYVKYFPYRGATLTAKGLKDRRKNNSKTRLLERFLQTFCIFGKIKFTYKHAKWNTRCPMKLKNPSAAF